MSQIIRDDRGEIIGFTVTDPLLIPPPINPILPIEIKTIGELIDELTITNIKIYTMEDLKRGLNLDDEGNAKAVADLAKKIQSCNDQRSALKNAITRRLEPGGREDVKVKT